MSDEEKKPESSPFGRIVNLEDWQNVVAALEGTLSGTMENSQILQGLVPAFNENSKTLKSSLSMIDENHEKLVSLYEAFKALEGGYSAMYDLVMRSHERINELEKRLNEKDNPR